MAKAGAKVSNLKLELLIEIVREETELYDCTLPAYKDANKQQNLWKAVSAKLDVEGMDGKYRSTDTDN